MSKKINIGIIGTGSRAETFLEACYQNHMECLAVCTTNETTGRNLADLFYVDNLYTSVEEMFDRNDLDFIFVTISDLSIIKECLEHGFNVVVYKKLSTIEEEILHDVAQKHNVFYVDSDSLSKLTNLVYIQDEVNSRTKILKVDCMERGDLDYEHGVLIYEFDTISGEVIEENPYGVNFLYDACKEIKGICEKHISL